MNECCPGIENYVKYKLIALLTDNPMDIPTIESKFDDNNDEEIAWMHVILWNLVDLGRVLITEDRKFVAIGYSEVENETN